MTETTHDPDHRVRYAFERDDDDLIVETWMEPSISLPEHTCTPARRSAGRCWRAGPACKWGRSGG